MRRPLVVSRLRWPRSEIIDASLAVVLWALDLLVSWNPERGAGQPVWLVPAYAAVGFSVLLVRRRFPRIVLAVLVLHSVLAAVLFVGYLPTLGVWLGLYTVASRCDLRWAVAGLLAAFVPAGLNVADAVGRQLPADRTSALIGTSVALTLFNLTIFGVGRWADWSVRQRRLVAEAARATATASERARIARDLHDVVAHAITLMLLQAGGAARFVRTDPDRAEAALGHVDAIGQQAIVELRRLLGLLRVEDRADAPAPGSLPGLARLDELVAAVDSGDLRVRLEVTGETGRLEPGVDLAAYRIVQEALTNASRYAPRPSEVRVALRWAPDRLEIEVVNRHADRHAATPAGVLSAGHGLVVMQERARSAGGIVVAGPQDDGTFAVRATLPTAAIMAEGA